MSVQKKLIDDILSLYDTILEKNNLYETTSNLRSTLNSLGYREKNYDLTTGGDVNDKLTDIVATILKQFKTNYPTAMVTVTSGNDRYHQNLGYKSQHTMGNAIDVVISPYDSKSSAAFRGETRARRAAVADRRWRRPRDARDPPPRPTAAARARARR